MPQASPPQRQPRWALLLATCGGIGLSPIIPGTLASLFAAAVCVAILLAGGPANAVWAMVPLTLLGGAVAVWVGRRARAVFGEDDPPKFVLDEVVGMWVAMLGIGADLALSWKSVAGAFVLFRFFDVVKPFPVSRLDRLRGAWGIVGDDIAAGVLAALVLRVASLILPL